MNMDTCPLCHGDSNKNIDATIAKMYAAGLCSVNRNPGGVGFEMRDGRRLHIIGECNEEDEQLMLSFLAAHYV